VAVKRRNDKLMMMMMMSCLVVYFTPISSRTAVLNAQDCTEDKASNIDVPGNMAELDS